MKSSIPTSQHRWISAVWVCVRFSPWPKSLYLLYVERYICYGIWNGDGRVRSIPSTQNVIISINSVLIEKRFVDFECNNFISTVWKRLSNDCHICCGVLLFSVWRQEDTHAFPTAHILTVMMFPLDQQQKSNITKRIEEEAGEERERANK